MHWDIGSIGLEILLALSLGFGAIAQLVVARHGPYWLWIVGALGWFAGGAVLSEIVVGTMTVDEIQPIIDGLAFDEALLGGLIGGILATAAGWWFLRTTTTGAGRTGGPSAI